jgi:hypothetical protein
MLNIARHLPFVNEQAGVHEKLSERYNMQPWRAERHQRSAATFKQISNDLEVAQRTLDECARQTQTIGGVKRMSLTLEDVDGLPPELLQELSISESDKLDFAIEAVVNEAGGVASLDKILIGLYKKTSEVHKRGTITSRLYRMRQKNTIFAVPNKSGFYSTKMLSEQDVKRLFGQDELDIGPDDDDTASPSVSSAPSPIRPIT